VKQTADGKIGKSDHCPGREANPINRSRSPDLAPHFREEKQSPHKIKASVLLKYLSVFPIAEA
jgi:hypothetical protein